MRKVKRLIALVGAALMVALTPASAMAATGGYVPTAGTYYYLENGQWVQGSSIKYSFKKDGRVTKRISIDSDGSVESDTYSWKGNYIKKVSHSYGSYSSTRSYKYKGKFLKSVSFSDSDGDSYLMSVKWKKKKGSVSYKVTGDYYTMSSGTLKLNGKNKIASETTTNTSGKVTKESSKYYSNGNIKSNTYVAENYSSKSSYNKNGYITTSFSTSSDGSYSVSRKYTMDKKKKCPKEVIITATMGGETSTSKIVFTAFKKVGKIRNCDAFGINVPLGY